MKNMLICGSPNIVLKLLIQSINKKYNLSFIGYNDMKQYYKIKELLEGESTIINRKDFSFKTLGKLFFKRYDVVLMFCTNNRISLFLMLYFKLQKIKIIVFPYDFPNRFLQRIYLKLADEVMSKGEKLPKDKPGLVFNGLIDKDKLQFKKHGLKNKINLVFIGGLWEGCVKCFKEIAKDNRFIIHVYAHTNKYKSKLLKQPVDNIILHGYIKDHKTLLEEITRYDFGLILSDRIASHNFMVKFYDYLCAGLPLIVSSYYDDVVDIVKKNRFGIVIFSPECLYDVIRCYDYSHLLENVEKNRKQFFMREVMI